MSFPFRKKLKGRFIRFHKRATSLSGCDNLDLSEFEKRIENLSFENCSPPKTVVSGDPIKGAEQSKAVTQSIRFSDCPLRSGKTYTRGRLNSEPTFSKTASQPTLPPDFGASPSGSRPSKMETSTAILEKVAKLVSRLVPTFPEGNRNNLASELHNFLDCCKQVNAALPTTEEKKLLIPLLKTKLRGEAYELVKYLDIHSLSELEQLLLNAFAPVKTINEILAEIRKCVQVPGERINSFGIRVNKHLLECKSAIMRKYSGNNLALIKEIEDEACFVFKVGILSPVIRQVIVAETEKSLDDLIQIAVAVEKTEDRQLLNRSIDSRLIASESRFTDSEIKQLKLLSKNLSTYPEEVAQIRPYHSEFTANSLPHLPFYTPQHSPPIQTTYSAPFNPYPPTTSIDSRSPIHLQQVPFPSQAVNIMANQVNPSNAYSHLTQNSTRRTCDFCKRFGHTVEECRSRTQGFCKKCTTLGHTEQNCPTPPSHIHRTEFNNQSGKITRPKCDWCARSSHTVEQCRAKKAWEYKQNLTQQRSGN